MGKKKKVIHLLDQEGWADAEYSKPPKFDLVLVKNEKGRDQLAWWTGYVWDYGYRRIHGEIKKWKRLPQGHECL